MILKITMTNASERIIYLIVVMLTFLNVLLYFNVLSRMNSARVGEMFRKSKLEVLRENSFREQNQTIQIVAFREQNQTIRTVQSFTKLQSKTKLLTLVTILCDCKDKYRLESNVLSNWALLTRDVNIVAFVRNTKSHQSVLAKSNGWKVQQITKTNRFGEPVLRDMIITAQRIFKTYFYGFAYSDILMTSELVDALSAVREIHENSCIQLLLLGRTFDILYANKVVPTLHTFSGVLKRIGNKKATMYRDGYGIIIGRNMDWELIPEFTVTNKYPGFDIHLATLVPILSFTIVDISSTVSALWQRNTVTVPSDTSHYNLKVLLNFTEDAEYLYQDSTRYLVMSSYLCLQKQRNNTMFFSNSCKGKGDGIIPVRRYLLSLLTK